MNDNNQIIQLNCTVRDPDVFAAVLTTLREIFTRMLRLSWKNVVLITLPDNLGIITPSLIPLVLCHRCPFYCLMKMTVFPHMVEEILAVVHPFVHHLTAATTCPMANHQIIGKIMCATENRLIEIDGIVANFDLYERLGHVAANHGGYFTHNVPVLERAAIMSAQMQHFSSMSRNDRQTAIIELEKRTTSELTALANAELWTRVPTFDGFLGNLPVRFRSLAEPTKSRLNESVENMVVEPEDSPTILDRKRYRDSDSDSDQNISSGTSSTIQTPVVTIAMPTIIPKLSLGAIRATSPSREILRERGGTSDCEIEALDETNFCTPRRSTTLKTCSAPRKSRAKNY